MDKPNPIRAFIQHWSNASASERSNSQLFLIELCDILELPHPDPHLHSGYAFEFPVDQLQRDNTTTQGRIDLYKRGCFVLESKQFHAQQAEPTDLQLAAHDSGAILQEKKKSGPVRGTERWDDAMFKARGQAERYIRSLPASEPTPPFLIVIDVGDTFEIYADFTQAGKAYLPFPDPRSFRLRLADLEKDEVRERLRTIWTDPFSLDPSRVSSAVTREIAGHLAELAKSLEAAGHAPQKVAEFLTRCLFCMFAEDVHLLPERSFTELLQSIPPDGTGFEELLRTLFREMNTGTGKGISVVLRKKLLQFNGGLFADDTVLPVNGLQLGLLKSASVLNWRSVEPAIFGTLLERALNPHERHKLGAHYTPRAYVERLVLPAVIEPIRSEWENVRAAALTLARADKLKEARAEILQFHKRLCHVKVLDPACGSGNFLYVALEHFKRLEGEVLDVATGFGETFKLELTGEAVDPHQFLGIELNPRAASIAELVLWIGYLQWHFRTRGHQTMPAEPVLKRFRNIECRDAVLAYDEVKEVTEAMAAANPDLPGLPDEIRTQLRSRRGHETQTFGEGDQSLLTSAATITIWDRRSMKTDLVTGRDVPDETKRTTLLAYINPRPAEWPVADYIVGNPPFLGPARMREALGDGYAGTLRETYPEVPESADFVMYWWHKAAALTRTGAVKRFGFITTNSLRQTFNRRVVQFHLAGSSRGNEAQTSGKKGQSLLTSAATKLSLLFAISDHPWVDTEEGAAVRIAMTVGSAGEHVGELNEVVDEKPQEDGSAEVTFDTQDGKLQADLTCGADVAGVIELSANQGLANRGFCLFGSGFIVTHEKAMELGLEPV